MTATRESSKTMPGRLDVIANVDCLAGMASLATDSVDMALVDQPYGTTRCAWDAVIDQQALWDGLLRVVKPNGAIIFTACQPFTSVLVMAKPKLLRQALVWEKSKATGWMNSKRRHLCAHEDILVFSRKPCTYNPQMRPGTPYDKGSALRPTSVYGSQRETHVKNDDGKRYPRTVIYFKTAESEGKVIHPTQKPVALFEYLVATYSNPGETVLDCCMGSGTTALAAHRTGRRFIGFESDGVMAGLACERIAREVPGFCASPCTNCDDAEASS